MAFNLILGLAFIALGLVYVWKPAIFRRGIWLNTSIAIRMLSEDNYRRYMQGLGIVLIVAGMLLVASAVFVRHVSPHAGLIEQSTAV